jgi:hypothetical protein
MAIAHDRWRYSQADFWDCRKVHGPTGGHKNVVKGILQLSDAVGLLPRLPADIEQVLSAFFAYRNNMFHKGFEWPVAERAKFANQIGDQGWPRDWFDVATSDDEPWIFYMSQTFIDHCLRTIDDILAGIGAYVLDRLQTAPDDP